MAKSPSDLIFEALCLRYRATTKVSKVMTRQELQEATDLPADVLMEALQALVGPNAYQSLFIRFVERDPDQITIGPGWMSRCEDTGKDAWGRLEPSIAGRVTNPAARDLTSTKELP
jgi:hypothetical protein